MRPILPALLIALPAMLHAQTTAPGGAGAPANPARPEGGTSLVMPPEANSATADHRLRKPSGTSQVMRPESNAATSDHRSSDKDRLTGRGGDSLADTTPSPAIPAPGAKGRPAN